MSFENCTMMDVDITDENTSVGVCLFNTSIISENNHIIPSSNLPKTNSLNIYKNVDENLNVENSLGSRTYKENDLFRFLNSTLGGQLMLSVYKNANFFNLPRLKELIILEEIGKDRINFKIVPETFIKIRTEILELFPCQDGDHLYTPYYFNPTTKEKVSAQGVLYEHYKTIRKQLRDAKFLNSKTTDEDDCIENLKDSDSLSLVTNVNPSQFPLSDIFTNWDSTFNERTSTLIKKKNKAVQFDQYLASFPCLRHPFGVLLLEQDFIRVIQNPPNDDNFTNSLKVSTIFSTSWTEVSTNIIYYCSKLKNKEIKQIFEKHASIIAEGTQNNDVALLLLPYCLRSVKTAKIKRTATSKTLSKTDIAKSFILHVDDESTLDEEKTNFENWLKEIEQPIFPYLISSGKLDSIKCFLILKNEKYEYDSLLRGVEACYKCFTALKSIPWITDFLWSFLDKITFRLSSKPSAPNVSKFLHEISKK